MRSQKMKDMNCAPPMPISPRLRCCRGIVLLGLSVFSAAAGSGSPASPAPPPPICTPSLPVETTVHGQTFTDEYRWLEDWNSAATKAWVQKQNERTETYIDGSLCGGRASCQPSNDAFYSPHSPFAKPLPRFSPDRFAIPT